MVLILFIDSLVDSEQWALHASLLYSFCLAVAVEKEVTVLSRNRSVSLRTWIARLVSATAARRDAGPEPTWTELAVRL